MLVSFTSRFSLCLGPLCPSLCVQCIYIYVSLCLVFLFCSRVPLLVFLSSPLTVSCFILTGLCSVCLFICVSCVPRASPLPSLPFGVYLCLCCIAIPPVAVFFPACFSVCLVYVPVFQFRLAYYCISSTLSIKLFEFLGPAILHLGPNLPASHSCFLTGSHFKTQIK